MRWLRAAWGWLVGKRYCEALACEARVGGARLFCARHWASVSYGVRARLAEAWGVDAEELAHQLLRASNECAVRDGLMDDLEAARLEERSRRAMQQRLKERGG
jgi:hypothetical protein